MFENSKPNGPNLIILYGIKNFALYAYFNWNIQKFAFVD